jgi:hypothetical protein
MTTHRPQPVPSITSHLRPDGTVFPPVTPEPPEPPGYVSPLDNQAELEISDSSAAAREGELTDESPTEAPD